MASGAISDILDVFEQRSHEVNTMTRGAGLVGLVLAGAFLILWIAATPAAPPPQSPVGKALVATTSGNKDEEAIRKAARDYCQAFDNKDAKAVAAQFTENAEFQNDAGEHLRGARPSRRPIPISSRKTPGARSTSACNRCAFLPLTWPSKRASSMKPAPAKSYPPPRATPPLMPA